MHAGDPDFSLQPIGHGFSRPECVLAHKSGLVFASDWSGMGGVRVLHLDGQATSIVATNSRIPVKPNGIALEPDGHFILAHLGDKSGGLLRMTSDGQVSSLISNVNGNPLPPTNYVVRDGLGRLWLTVSTTKIPRSKDYRRDASSGFIAVVLPGQDEARIVADNLGYTNECVIDSDSKVLYVNETFAQRLSRFDISDDGGLSNKYVLAQFDEGTFPDGLCLDANGDLWVTGIISNRLIRVSPTGQQTLMYEDSDRSYLLAAISALHNNSLSAVHLGNVGCAQTQNISSLAFGGTDMSTMYLGNLLGDTLYTRNSSTAGKPMAHWDIPLGALESLCN